MVELFAVFFKTIHRTEIVALPVVITDYGLLFRYVDPTDGITVSYRVGPPVSKRFCLRFLCSGQREENAVPNIQQQAPYQ